MKINFAVELLEHKVILLVVQPSHIHSLPIALIPRWEDQKQFLLIFRCQPDMVPLKNFLKVIHKDDAVVLSVCSFSHPKHKALPLGTNSGEHFLEHF